MLPGLLQNDGSGRSQHDWQLMIKVRKTFPFMFLIDGDYISVVVRRGERSGLVH